MSATIGNFDGLHIGHQAILDNLKEEAKDLGTSTLVFFTEPHAAEYFSAKGLTNNQSPPRLCPWREKFRLLNNYGIDYACFLKFNSSLKSMTPENFIKDIKDSKDHLLELLYLFCLSYLLQNVKDLKPRNIGKSNHLNVL